VIVLNAQTVAVRAIHVYRHALAPIADRMGMRCRFTPSCSRYAEIAITRDGVTRGGWKALKRIGRCGPWTPLGPRDDP
jgi:putative membrane protein insertion efficiency factor